MKYKIEIPFTSILVIATTFSLLLFNMSLLSIPIAEAKYVFSNKWGMLGPGDGQFKYPIGIDVDTSGRAYVVDYLNNRIQQFKFANPCPVGTVQVAFGVCFVKVWGTSGLANGQFNQPIGLALDSSGRVYVAEFANNRIQIFKGNGAFSKAWGTLGAGDGQFNGPSDVAVDNAGHIYVVDTNNRRIQKFDLANPCPAGTAQVVAGICFVTKWGTFGTANGQFIGARGIAVDSSGYVYVVDQNNHRVQKFTNNGEFVGKWGTEGSASGQFRYPFGIAVDSSGYVYVADRENNRIQKFLIQKFNTTIPCPAGTAQVVFGACLVTKWGSEGLANGQFKEPIAVAVDGMGRIYVSDHSNHRIQAFFWKPSDVGGMGGSSNEPDLQ
ncbi:MAG TPA: 6-bladed beta-propeller [Nitrososphaeraceae archaeon]